MKLNPNLLKQFTQGTFKHNLKISFLKNHKLITDFSPYKIVNYLNLTESLLRITFESYLEIYVRYAIKNLHKNVYHYKVLNSIGISNINSVISILLDNLEQKFPEEKKLR